MKITMDYPSLEEEVSILERHHTNAALVKLEDVHPVITRDELLAFRKLMDKVFVVLRPVLLWLCCSPPRRMPFCRDAIS